MDGDFQEIALEDYRGKWLIFFFYPLDFTFVCPTEIIAFSDRYPEFEALNTAVVACSTDSHFSHLAWTNTPKNRGGTRAGSTRPETGEVCVSERAEERVCVYDCTVRLIKQRKKAHKTTDASSC